MEDFLIERIQNNEQEAFEELLQQYSKMIYSIIAKRDLTYGDYLINQEDLYQEGTLALLAAAKSYRPEKGVSFTTYAYTVIRRKVNKYYLSYVLGVKDECISYSKMENIDRSLSYATNYVSDNPIMYAKEMEVKENLIEKIKSLNDFDRKIILLKANGLTYKEIAQALSVSQKKVDNRLQKLKKRYNKVKTKQKNS